MELDNLSAATVFVQIFSQYKHFHTVKFNVGGHAAGIFYHVSAGYGGSISDDDLLLLSGILQQLPRGSRLLLDKGYKTALVEALKYVSW